jgi:hypothetical protein
LTEFPEFFNALSKGRKEGWRRRGMAMEEKELRNLFSEGTLNKIFPEQRADQFFEALYGEHEEGTYNINLQFEGYDLERKILLFGLVLKERPGKCLACNLTYGLPQVFSRHPVINIQGIVREIQKLLGEEGTCGEWNLGRTNPVSSKLHIIPLTIQIS